VKIACGPLLAGRASGPALPLPPEVRLGRDMADVRARSAGTVPESSRAEALHDQHSELREIGQRQLTPDPVAKARAMVGPSSAGTGRRWLNRDLDRDDPVDPVRRRWSRVWNHDALVDAQLTSDTVALVDACQTALLTSAQDEDFKIKCTAEVRHLAAM
jgi:hypothetical protein